MNTIGFNQPLYILPGFIGFAVGRTSFWDPLIDWRAKKITREDAVNEISPPLQRLCAHLRAEGTCRLSAAR